MPEKVFVRLFDFKIYNDKIEVEESDDEEYKPKKKIPKETIVRMYGMNEKGKTFCLNVIDYKPFFYVKIPDYWEYSEISQFKSSLKRDLGYLKDDLIKVKEVNKKKLYGFDKHKEHKFLVLQFNNTIAWTKARALWYDNEVFGKRVYGKMDMRKQYYMKLNYHHFLDYFILRIYHHLDGYLLMKGILNLMMEKKQVVIMSIVFHISVLKQKMKRKMLYL